MQPANEPLRRRPPNTSGYLPVLAMSVILLLAFGLRVYHLDFQSIWTDEGRSFLRASVPLSQVASVTPVEHMPTYFAMLHVWLGLAGNSDFALRFLSLWASVLAVALAYRLAVELGQRRTGLIAALLLATGSFQITYAQEARMYTWMLATSLAATWCFWCLLNQAQRGAQTVLPGDRRSRLVFAGYVLSVAATIYLHHYGFVLPLAHTVFALIWLGFTRDRRAFLRWFTAGFAVVLLYLPAVPQLLGMLGYSGWQQTETPVSLLPWYFLTAYTAGDPMPGLWHTWLPWLYALFVLAGFYAWWRANRLAALLVACTLALPLAAAWALAFSQPQFHERYTMLVTAPLMLLAANGFSLFSLAFWMRAVRKRWMGLMLPAAGAVVLAGVVGTNGLALDHLYHDSTLQKPDYRSVASMVQEQEQPGDLIISDDSMLDETFMHYYTGGLPIHDLKLLKFAGEQQAYKEVEAVTAGARRAWKVEHYGGAVLIDSWLAKNGWPALKVDSNGLHLGLYGLPGLPQVQQAAHVPFGQALVVTGVTVAGGTPGAGRVAFHAGDLAGVTTRWQVQDRLPALKFSLRLVDAAGRLWTAADYVPLDGLAPTDTWQPGVEAMDRRGILLPATLPPGEYTISLVLYDPATGVAVPSGDEPGATLSHIDVLPAGKAPDPGSLPIPVRTQTAFGTELELLGYGIEPQPVHVESGGRLSVWWRAVRAPSQPYQLQVEVTRSNGETVARSQQALSIAPTDTWLEGQIVGERYDIAVDPAAASGTYQLRLALAGRDGALIDRPVIVGRIAVEARARAYRLPAMDRSLDMTLGQTIALRGYTLDRPAAAGDSLKLSLYWQALTRVQGGYKVFVHLVDDAGNIAAQQDGFPADGTAPTESWLAKEVIEDTYALTVPASGHYRLRVGMYDPADGQRLPATDQAGQPVPDSAIPLEEVVVP